VSPAAAFRRAGVTVLPPAPVPDAAAALPIFEAVESDWFRARGRRLSRPAEDGASGGLAAAAVPAAGLMASPVGAAGPGGVTASAAPAWGAADDHGWQAAEVVLDPVTGGTTTAGLPRRTPRANLVPGAAVDRAGRPPRPAEPPEAARSRLAGLQRGSLRARAAVSEPGGDQ
jgi:hypothetical protein